MWWRTKNERIEFLESCKETQLEMNGRFVACINHIDKQYKENREESQKTFKELQNQINDLNLKLNIVQNLKLTNLKKGKKK